MERDGLRQCYFDRLTITSTRMSSTTTTTSRQKLNAHSSRLSRNMEFLCWVVLTCTRQDLSFASSP
eukprot:3371385-Amphidinium_carterae.1